jgi:hypothetical protein
VYASEHVINGFTMFYIHQGLPPKLVEVTRCKIGNSSKLTARSVSVSVVLFWVVSHVQAFHKAERAAPSSQFLDSSYARGR